MTLATVKDMAVKHGERHPASSWRRALSPAFAMLCVLAGSGCQSLARTPFSYAELRAASPDMRMDFDDPGDRGRFVTGLMTASMSSTDGTFDLLALSGGGADGAYGAGVLTGWSDRGDRPQFEVVTGVSTGALMAPFAFIGPDGDAELSRAFVDGRTSGVLEPRWVMAAFGPGLYRQGPLKARVASVITPEMIDAVAAQHRLGRRLFVATTSLDTQRQVIWDLGALAAGGDRNRREKFIDILVASASIPVIFPPVLIELERDGARVRELHADGRTTANFFVAPERLMLDRELLGSPAVPGHVWVLVNGSPEPQFMLPPQTSLGVAARSLDALMKASTRINLIAVSEFSRLNDLRLSVTVMPSSMQSGSLNFGADRAVRLFDAGRTAAAAGTAWEAYEHPDTSMEEVVQP